VQRRGKGTQARLRDGGRGVLDASRVDRGKGRHDSLRRVLLQVDPPCPEGGRRVAKGADQRAHLLLVGDEAEGEPLAKLNLERIELADRDPAALRHERIGVEDVIGRLGGEDQRGDE